MRMDDTPNVKRFGAIPVDIVNKQSGFVTQKDDGKPIPSFLINQQDAEGPVKTTTDIDEEVPSMRDVLATKAVAGVEAVNMLVQERDRLRAIANDQANELREYRRETDRLANELNLERARADHYQRYSVEIATQLNTISMVVADAMKRAREHALHGNSNSANEQAALAAVAEELST